MPFLTYCVAGLIKSWDSHPKLPAVTIRTLFTRFLDITTPPAPSVLRLLASTAKDVDEMDVLNGLAAVRLFFPFSDILDIGGCRLNANPIC
jgi:hypothetical protein